MALFCVLPPRTPQSRTSIPEITAISKPNRMISREGTNTQGSASSNGKLRIGFVGYPSQKWLAGIIYIQNLLRALVLAGEEVEVYLFLVSQNHHVPNDLSSPNLKFEALHHIDDRSGWKKCRTYLDLFLRLKECRVQVVHNFVFPLPSWLRIPSVVWLPDFQYIHRPDFFSAEEIKKRYRYEKRLARFSKRVILSSKEARRDFERVLPQYSDKARVIHFSSLVTEQDMTCDVDPRVKFRVDSPFFIVCNQFWKHKNHVLVLEAVALLKKRTTHNFQVIFTGPMHDFRNPTFFDEVLERVNRLGVGEQCNILGQIPRQDVLQLMCKSMCVIQPSLFEGWNTVVEECRALGVPVLLSDITVHQEQAEEEGLQAAFFDPVTPEDLAQLMLNVLEGQLFSLSPDKRSLDIAQIHQRARLYAEQVLTVWREVAAP
ncbi:MAG: glycosyltransferase family 4 protein [Planctomycetota bacterium]